MGSEDVYKRQGGSDEDQIVRVQLAGRDILQQHRIAAPGDQRALGHGGNRDAGRTRIGHVDADDIDVQFEIGDPVAPAACREVETVRPGAAGQDIVARPADQPVIAALTRQRVICLLYTSDAADEEDSVDFVGLRNIKKKKKKLFFFFFKQKTAYEM